ncbi:hypothetical protein MJO28_011400 [Puccinia striiformis f. sp. tritici]|uniref:Uncharacterized protein n=1 Tax=Puccinia striiformis f. sp. tritici TaxID=168172 RepID=A0ACC0E2L1_9BASI|nr:hypothetical protein MJO28_011400 [Puccinia striiformis f. sp. tritici]
MRSFLAVNISLALLQSSLAAPIHGTTNINTGNTINCSNSAAPAVAAPPPVPAATNPFAKTFPQRPVPTGKFGPRSSIGAVGILMNSFGFPASSLPTFGQGNPDFGQVDPSISQINPGLVKVTQALAKSTQDSTKEVPTWANLFQTSDKICINSVGVAPTMTKLHLTPPQARVVLMVCQDRTPVPMAMEESRNLV